MTKKLTPEEKEANKMARAAARLQGAHEKEFGKKAKGKKAKAEKPAKETKATKKNPAFNVHGGGTSETLNAAGIGHNATGKTNVALVALFDEYTVLEENARAVSKAKRELRARAKDEHNITAAVFNHEAKMRRMELDARVMFENGCADIKHQLGYQFALDLHGAPQADDGEESEQEENDVDDNGGDPVEAARQAAMH